jgi:hypothetical protein
VKPNPYAPGFGQAPPWLAGRARQQSYVDYVLRQFEARRRAESAVWSGARGMGKTVLLLDTVDRAKARGWIAGYAQVVRAEDPAAALGRLIDDARRRVGRQRALVRALDEAIGSLGVSMAGGAVRVDLGLREPAKRRSLADALHGLGELASRRRVGVLLGVDEAQALGAGGLGEMLGALAVVRNLPVAVMFTGLTTLPARVREAGTFAERLVYDEVDLLDESDARDAFVEGATAGGGRIDSGALPVLTEAARGYPYFVQLVGREAWEAASRDGRIDMAAARAGVRQASSIIERTIFSPRYERCSPVERRYLRAVAAGAGQGEGPAEVSAVATALRRSLTELSYARARLIDKGIIVPAGRGRVAFALPGFAQFVRDRGETTALPEPPG